LRGRDKRAPIRWPLDSRSGFSRAGRSPPILDADHDDEIKRVNRDEFGRTLAANHEWARRECKTNSNSRSNAEKMQKKVVTRGV
jgi:hypothetical protein